MTIFTYAEVSHNPNFAAGLVPPAAVAPVVPGRKAREEGPTDAERIAWYFRDEIRAANEIIEADAAEYEALTSLSNGYCHA